METLYATPTTKYVEVLQITRVPCGQIGIPTTLSEIDEFLDGSTAEATVGYDGLLYLHDKDDRCEDGDVTVEYGDFLVKVFGDVEIFSADEFAKHFEIV
jgi:hypothetical protein